LLLQPQEGLIEEAPAFFYEALELDPDRSTTIFELFDADRLPHLSFSRVYARAAGVLEYHVFVDRGLGEPLGFRYWDLTSHLADDHERMLAFYLVDDTSVLLSHEWRFRKLRRYILGDVQSFVEAELKNRLSTLHALAEVLRDSPDSARESAERLIETIDSFEGVIDRIDEELDDTSSGIGLEEEIPMRIVDIPAILSSWGEEFVVVETQAPDLDDDIMIKSTVLERVLFPVVKNAVESRPRDGRVDVEIQLLEDPRSVCFEIVDHGGGMTPYELSRAEDPFFSNKRGHAGLGLSKARDTLRAIGGYWNIKSRESVGTTVRVCVPALSVDDYFQ